MVLSVEGVERLLKKLAPANIRRPVMSGLQRIALKLERVIKQATVVDTGRLRASIGHSFGESSAIIATSVQYAKFVEFGTSRMESRHMEGTIKILGEGGSFQYGMHKLPEILEEEQGKIIGGIQTEIRRG